MSGRFADAPRMRVRAKAPLVNTGSESDVVLELPGGTGGGGTDTHTVSATTPAYTPLVPGDVWLDTSASGTGSWAFTANPPRGKAYGGGITPGAGSWSNMIASAAAYNTGGAAGGTPLVLNPVQFTCPVAGIYHFELEGQFPAGPSPLLGFRLNGSASQVYGVQAMHSIAGWATYGTTSLDMELAAGSYINPAVLLTSGSSTFTLVYFAARYVSPT